MSVEDPVTARRIRRDVHITRARPGAPPPRALGARDLDVLRRDAFLRRDPVTHREPLSEAPDVSVEEHEPAVTQLHWIEIELVDEDGQPFPGVRYEAKLPNGSVRRGRIGRDGVVRIDGIRDAGSVEITFPDLDEEACSPA